MTFRSSPGPFALLAILALFCCRGGGIPMADKVLINGRIWTADPARPWAEAVAIRDGRIAAVGTTGEIRKLAGRETETIDLRARLSCPASSTATSIS